jgi:hypothetical protein
LSFVSVTPPGKGGDPELGTLAVSFEEPLEAQPVSNPPVTTDNAISEKIRFIISSEAIRRA